MAIFRKDLWSRLGHKRCPNMTSYTPGRLSQTSQRWWNHAWKEARITPGFSPAQQHIHIWWESLVRLQLRGINMHACTFKIPLCCLVEVCCLVIIWISCNATKNSACATFCSPLKAKEGQEKCNDNHLAFITSHYYLNQSSYWHYALTKKVDSTFPLLEILLCILVDKYGGVAAR